MTLEIGKSTDNISRSVSGIPSRLTKDLDAKGYYIVDAQNYIDMLSGKGLMQVGLDGIQLLSL
jgi:hypothetical protein